MLRFAARTTHPWSPPGWIWVIVHDSRAQLQEHAVRYATERGWENDHRESEACFHSLPFRVGTNDEGGVTDPAPHYAGVLRMLPEHGVATLAHECTHAAIALYARQHAVTFDAGGDMDDEEVLCYAVGDLVGTIAARLIKEGVW